MFFPKYSRGTLIVSELRICFTLCDDGCRQADDGGPVDRHPRSRSGRNGVIRAVATDLRRRLRWARGTTGLRIPLGNVAHQGVVWVGGRVGLNEVWRGLCFLPEVRVVVLVVGCEVGFRWEGVGGWVGGAGSVPQ